jgi:hypothetical protein
VVVWDTSKTSNPFLARVSGRVRGYLGSSVHATGATWVQQELGVGPAAKQMPGWAKWLGRAFVGYAAYHGFKEGGLSGAVTGTATHLAAVYAFGAGLKALGLGMKSMLGSPLGFTAVGLGAVGAGVYGRKQLIDTAREHQRRLGSLEMATPVLDQFGTLATMRQRSITAIQNSHLNGRNALGNEAALMYRPYFR